MPASAPPPGPSDPHLPSLGGLGQGGPWIPQPVLGLHEPLPTEQLAHLQNLLVILRGVEPPVSNDVLYQLLVVLCEPPEGREAGEGSGPRGPLPRTSVPPPAPSAPATGSSASAPVCPVPALFSLRFGDLGNSYSTLKTLHQLLPPQCLGHTWACSLPQAGAPEADGMRL